MYLVVTRARLGWLRREVEEGSFYDLFLGLENHFITYLPPKKIGGISDDLKNLGILR